jgi:hypothetical protein
LTFWGTPWVKGLPRWAFNEDRKDMRRMAFGQCPEAADILITHGPLFQYGDFTVPKFGSEHVGDNELNRMVHRVRPRTVVCGHIHEGYGFYRHSAVTKGIYNVAYNDENYEPREETSVIIYDDSNH